jgi:hypothetical protein
LHRKGLPDAKALTQLAERLDTALPLIAKNREAVRTLLSAMDPQAADAANAVCVMLTDITKDVDPDLDNNRVAARHLVSLAGVHHNSARLTADAWLVNMTCLIQVLTLHREEYRGTCMPWRVLRVGPCRTP